MMRLHLSRSGRQHRWCTHATGPPGFLLL